MLGKQKLHLQKSNKEKAGDGVRCQGQSSVLQGGDPGPPGQHDHGARGRNLPPGPGCHLLTSQDTQNLQGLGSQRLFPGDILGLLCPPLDVPIAAATFC